ncbi:MAG: hypothetical protein JWQ87_1027 [Candidatus Sulfotelmatobacter sp.]|nr:hypothetical protein [Candidatus Sulfotelmatobacter sp.]
MEIQDLACDAAPATVRESDLAVVGEANTGAQEATVSFLTQQLKRDRMLFHRAAGVIDISAIAAEPAYGSIGPNL